MGLKGGFAMVWRLLTLVSSVLMIVNGIGLFGREDCETISFDGQGGRAFTVDCYADSSGAIPASLAGVLLLAGGLGLFWLWRRQVRRYKALRMAAAWLTVQRTRTGLSVGGSSTPPEMMLMAHAPDDRTLGAPLMSMLMDYRGGSAGGGTAAVRAARQYLPSEVRAEVDELAGDLVLAVRGGGQIGAGLAHATFVVTMRDLAGVDDETELPIHEAIAAAASDAVEHLVNRGRLVEAQEVAALAGKLYFNASNWSEVRNPSETSGEIQ
jgi:hypothetical protein